MRCAGLPEQGPLRAWNGILIPYSQCHNDTGVGLVAQCRAQMRPYGVAVFIQPGTGNAGTGDTHP